MRLLFVCFALVGLDSTGSSEELSVLRFRVPSHFGEIIGSGTQAVGTDGNEATNRLRAEGIAIPEEGSVIYQDGILSVRCEPAQVALVEPLLDLWFPPEVDGIIVTAEFIEVPHLDYSDWLFENRFESDATRLRIILADWIREGRAELLETVSVSSKSGQRSKAQSGEEIIYPTEMDPPEIPNEVTLSGKDADPGVTYLSPTAFETRDIGHTLEVDPVIGYDDTTIDLNLSPELVNVSRFIRYPRPEEDDPSNVDFPVFRMAKVTTQVTTLPGRYQLIGSGRPADLSRNPDEDTLVLFFARADLKKQRRWQRLARQ
ncbi:MAG: hypothetical protein AAF236_12125 [Verrucomicrobiota bacterium]